MPLHRVPLDTEAQRQPLPCLTPRHPGTGPGQVPLDTISENRRDPRCRQRSPDSGRIPASREGAHPALGPTAGCGLRPQQPWTLKEEAALVLPRSAVRTSKAVPSGSGLSWATRSDPEQQEVAGPSQALGRSFPSPGRGSCLQPAACSPVAGGAAGRPWRPPSSPGSRVLLCLAFARTKDRPCWGREIPKLKPKTWAREALPAGLPARPATALIKPTCDQYSGRLRDLL